MTASTGELLERLESLVSLFNRGSLDLPDGLLDRNAQFRLNGVAYEESLGRSSDDPLVRLIARGPGAYRFLAKAVRYAMPDACMTLGALTRTPDGSGFTLGGPATLSGLPRGADVPLRAACGIALTFDVGAHLVAVAVTLDEAPLARLRAARAGGA